MCLKNFTNKILFNNYEYKKYNFIPETHEDTNYLFEEASIIGNMEKINYILENSMINTFLLDNNTFELIEKKGLIKICVLWIKLGFRPRPSSKMYNYYENYYTFKTIM